MFNSQNSTKHQSAAKAHFVENAAPKNYDLKNPNCHCICLRCLNFPTAQML